MKKWLLLIAVCTGAVAATQPYKANWQSLNTRKMPAWFSNAKFGIFIHWGTYSVPAWAPVIENSGYSYAEWYWYRLQEGQKDFVQFHTKNYGAGFPYPMFEKSFHAELFDPAQWAALFKNAGARYVVLTSKHHEGYTLWNSAEADKSWGRPWNAVTGTPQRDLLGDLSAAVREAGLKMGYYYSLYEWFNPLWLKDKKRYVAEHMTPQFKDLVTRYKPSIIFSDGEWELPDTAWQSPQLLAWLFNESPVKDEVVVNDRWGSNTRGKNSGATYATSEYGSGMDASVTWEENQGIGHSYGYNRAESLADYKSSNELILMLMDIVARGGNLLLDVGPTADGRIPVIMQQRLTDMGNWLQKNGDAVYDTRAWKQPYQWSNGPRAVQKDASFMAGYSISKMATVRTDSAYIEALFTRRGQDLFCTLPFFMPSFTLRNFTPQPGTRALVLDSGTAVPFTQKGADCVLHLGALAPGSVPGRLLVLKLQNALPKE